MSDEMRPSCDALAVNAQHTVLGVNIKIMEPEPKSSDTRPSPPARSMLPPPPRPPPKSDASSMPPPPPPGPCGSAARASSASIPSTATTGIPAAPVVVQVSGPPPQPAAAPPASESETPMAGAPPPAPPRPAGSSYTPPPWAASKPASTFALEVIRDGCVIETLDVSSRGHYILGRQAETADYVVGHPSVSRQHCVIQHSQTGEVFLRDLDSTHGTYINNQRIPPSSFVALRIGAAVRLGQSNRQLILMGDADPARESANEASRAAMREADAERRAAARAERLQQLTGRSKVSAEDLHGADGAGWGFDAEEGREDARADTGGGGGGGGGGAAGVAGVAAPWRPTTTRRWPMTSSPRLHGAAPSR